MNDTYFYLPKGKQARLVPIYEEVGGQLEKVAAPFTITLTLPTLPWQGHISAVGQA